MNGHPKQAPDPIGAAIAKTAPQPGDAITMAGFNLTFGTTGRPFTVAVPADMTVVEIMDLITWIAHPTQGIARKLAEQQGPQLLRAGSMAGLPKPPT